MKYEHIIKGIFLERPNRFIAHVAINGNIEKAHVKNTGRCRELLVPGVCVYLEDFRGRMGSRKLRYSLIGVEKKVESGTILVNVDSHAPNQVVKEALEQGRLIPSGLSDVKEIRGEYSFGSSRLDFYVEDTRENKALMEVKGVTLEEQGMAKFPDAPTERGVRHIEELMEAKRKGYQACIVFMIQMTHVQAFTPNYETHRQFGETLCRANAAGVEILAYDCVVEADSLRLNDRIPIVL